MRVMIKAAAAAVVLLTAAPALALTTASTPSAASLAGARFLNDAAALEGPISNLQGAVVGFGLRTDGRAEFSGDSSGSYGYLTSAEPADPSKAVVAPYFENELPTYRTPGVTVYYGKAAGGQVAATPHGK